MKTPFFSIPQGFVRHTLSTLLIGVGCAYPVLLVMALPAPLMLCAVCCALVTLAIALCSCMPRLRLLNPLVLAAVMAALWPYRDHLQPISHALTLFMQGQPLALAAYARPVIALISVLTTLMGASLARSDHAIFPLSCIAVCELALLSLLGPGDTAYSLLPLLAALLLAAGMPGISALRLLPIAAAAFALTLALAPMSASTVPSLESFAGKVQQVIDDYFFFTEPRTAFSLSQTGYQPYGMERLGGSASPTDDPVMQVKTPERALLRATIKNEYTGLAWADTTSGRRYLFVSPRFADIRRDLFDQARPGDPSVLPGNRTLDITMVADNASTLFLTQRFHTPKGEGVVSYFSPSSEVFATRSLAAGDRYTFSGRLLDAASQGARRAVLASLDTADPHYESVKDTYLQLPASVESEVYEIARELTQGYNNDFDRAGALCLYLQRSFPYSLEQNEPPLTRDFVSWFLLEEKRGYCTSFASSLTVLARAAGMPARYVEGYAASPDADGFARVTQKDAHAWTEIYFPGFGWLSFDPTPGAGGVPDHNSDNDPEAGPQNDSGNPPHDPDNPADSPDHSDAPTPSPTPTPVPTPSPTPGHSDPAVTPTPEITPSPAPTPLPTPTPSVPPNLPRDDDPDSPPGWLAALLLLALIALAVLRMIFTSPARVASRYRNPGDQVLIWYHALEQALSSMDLPRQDGEAPATYLMRCQESLGGRVTLMKLGKALCVARYSARKVKPAAAEKAEATYRAVYARLTPVQKLRLHAHRFVHGLSINDQVS
ncbi:MAG: transglutaminase domain-containing protein [Clostridia bacterium]|nr:transglutaminase domain-containing protein [Clostridia bacterium]